MSKLELILEDFLEKLPTTTLKERYLDMYKEYPISFSKLFAYLHPKLNELLIFLNTKNEINRHYNADQSRELIFIINSIEELNNELAFYGEEIVISNEYKELFSNLKQFLIRSGGSPIPEDFPKVNVVQYEPIFSTSSTKIIVANNRQNLDLQVVGEGAFSVVSRYKDPLYNKFYAIKTLKRNSTEREIDRFKREFYLLQKLKFPYILEVYSLDDEKNSYVMEYCDNTLKKYIITRNNQLGFLTRKRIALQFLYAINYLHSKEILHRDISYTNILIKEFEGAVIIKLSDFGLMKEKTSEFTNIDTEIKGTIIDPTLQSFKEYSITNEIYSIGYILQFIFTGKQNFQSSETSLSKIIEMCINSSLNKRYKTVSEVINVIEVLLKNN